MDLLKIVCRINVNKNIYFCDYIPELDSIIENFKTVRVFKGKCYIRKKTLGIFVELLQQKNISFSVITTLI